MLKAKVFGGINDAQKRFMNNASLIQSRVQFEIPTLKIDTDRLRKPVQNTTLTSPRSL